MLTLLLKIPGEMMEDDLKRKDGSPLLCGKVCIRRSDVRLSTYCFDSPKQQLALIHFGKEGSLWKI